jgi:hypothetical protein
LVGVGGAVGVTDVAGTGGSVAGAGLVK